MPTLPKVDLVQGKNKYLVLDSPDIINKQIKKDGDWGAFENQIAQLIIEDFVGPNTVLDIGANVGTFTVNAAKHLIRNNGEVHCFEPQRIVFQQMCGNIFINSLQNVYAHNIVVGEKCEDIEIPEISMNDCVNIGGFSVDPLVRRCIDETPGAAFFGTSNFETGTVVCSKRTIDSFYFEKPISIIKLDVEGFELEALMGAVATLKSHNWPTIIYEDWDYDWYAPKSENIRFLLEELGYLITKAADTCIAQHTGKTKHITVLGNGPFAFGWSFR